MTLTPFAQWLAREGKSLRDVADHLGTTRQAVGLWSKGRNMPQGRNLTRLMALTGLEAGHFIPVRFKRARIRGRKAA